MDFQTAVRTVLTRKYADFTGRAARPEFWWFALFNFGGYVAISLVFGAVVGAVAGGTLASIWSLAMLVPGLAVGARRLHDIGKSGWWQAIALAVGVLAFIPFVGWLAALGVIGLLIYWMAQPGTGVDNAWGPPPAP